jgi:glycosyltransferase involved in cell wall biosynthesis
MLVSAVIPTRNRSHLVLRAVRSALAQTHRELEVIVVMDGPDISTATVLAGIVDPRLRIVQLRCSVGGSDARNAGISEASAEWIALLDDDDEWLPCKIERQLAILPRLETAFPIISCRFLAHTNSGDYVWPNRFPAPSEPMSEYLLVREGLTGSSGFIATPTILAPRSLLRMVPFQSSLRKHQDWDWVLRATAKPNVAVFFCDETLAVCHMRESNSTSRTKDWKCSLDWIQGTRNLVTPRAYAAFLASYVVWEASAQRHWRALFPLLWESYRTGSLRKVDLVRFMGFWFLPAWCRRWIKLSLAKS